MKKISLKSMGCFLGCAAILTACGGSTDDEAGAPAALAVVPTELTVTVPAGGQCDGIGDPVTGVATAVAKVFIKGGAAPYRVESASPERVAVSPARVSNRDEGFEVFLLGGCVNPATIVVTDSLNVFTTFQVTYSAEGA